MGVYSLDAASPKKANAGFHNYRSGTFSDLRRRLAHRRYVCLWILVALVPCYILRQITFNEAPTAGHVRRPSANALLTTSGASERIYTADKSMPYGKSVEVKHSENLGGHSLVKHPTTIKPAQYDSPLSKEKLNMTIGNSLKLKLKDNFEEDDEDFGVPEDNDKLEEQSWKAPPTPSEKRSYR